jgi:hypothetical protein
MSFLVFDQAPKNMGHDPIERHVGRYDQASGHFIDVNKGAVALQGCVNLAEQQKEEDGQHHDHVVALLTGDDFGDIEARDRLHPDEFGVERARLEVVSVLAEAS